MKCVLSEIARHGCASRFHAFSRRYRPELENRYADDNFSENRPRPTQRRSACSKRTCRDSGDHSEPQSHSAQSAVGGRWRLRGFPGRCGRKILLDSWVHAIVTRVLTHRIERFGRKTPTTKKNGHGIVSERSNSLPGKVPGSALYSPDNAAPGSPIFSPVKTRA